jgi:hypothetical protein
MFFIPNYDGATKESFTAAADQYRFAGAGWRVGF